MFTEQHNMKITEKIVDITKGEENIIQREETAAEIAEREKSEAEEARIAALQAEVDAAKEAAQTKLAAIGLTTDDLKALGL